ATKRHLGYLESKYNIKIITLKPDKSIGVTKKEFGVPFLSKNVSQNIERLANKNFDFTTTKNYEELITTYPKIISAAQWWSNKKTNAGYSTSMFDINYNLGLKEFLQAHPPEFKISSKCCHYLKKVIGKKFEKENNIDLKITGVRKAEGGLRSKMYTSCFSPDKNGVMDNYRPIFFYTKQDKEEYNKYYNIKNSDCYTVYGMKRTGCCGCPFSKNFKAELDIVKEYEPRLYKACLNLFSDAYEYTQRYKTFKKAYSKRSSITMTKPKK
ncbi:hypothetical protein AN396_02215, partial [Candidatus Epulonipiscium fishelsonii]